MCGRDCSLPAPIKPRAPPLHISLNSCPRRDFLTAPRNLGHPLLTSVNDVDSIMSPRRDSSLPPLANKVRFPDPSGSLPIKFTPLAFTFALSPKEHARKTQACSAVKGGDTRLHHAGLEHGIKGVQGLSPGSEKTWGWVILVPASRQVWPSRPNPFGHM